MGSAGDVDLFFDHVGIVTADLDDGCRKLAALLQDVQWTRRFDDGELGVSVRFARDRAGMVYELIAPLGATSPVARTLKARKDLLNQIAYRTPSLESTVTRLRANSLVPVGRPATALAFGGARIQFLMTPFDFLIELIEVDRVVHEYGDFCSGA